MTTPALADRIDAAVLLFEAQVHHPSSTLGTLLEAARSLSRLLPSDEMKKAGIICMGSAFPFPDGVYLPQVEKGLFEAYRAMVAAGRKEI